MFDYAQAAVEGALAAGATYADARAMIVRQQGLSCLNQNIHELDYDESAGVGVRALIGSSWGFYATPELSDRAAREAGARAAAIAHASGLAAGEPLQLLDVPVVTDHYETPFEEAPFDVALSEKADLLVAGAEMAATALGESETQRRSYPQSFGQFETGGYEVIRRFDLAGNAGRVAEEAVALLTAPECPSGTIDLVLESSQLALQIHESVGHATELDRILGWEAAFAGTSWLDLDQLGTLKFGSPVMNITADATLPGALATFGYDDEGTPAQRVDIVRDGIWVGVLSGRDSAAIAGLPPGGMVRGDGYNRLPMVRMTNIGLLPGDSSLEEIIADTKDGVYMATNRSWSIDDKRLNFQFGCEAGWEIKDGKLGRMVRNPTYTGISPQFWGSMDRLAGQDEMTYWGIPNCGKGQPGQSGHTGHPAAPARFRDVRVGVTG
jgi:TldD protein